MNKSKRSKKEDIYKKIIDFLKTGSYNILQISEKTGINWETVKNAVNMLKKINLVSKKDKKYYVDESKFMEYNKETLLGLPLTKEQETQTICFAKRIAEIWTKRTKKSLRKTFLHKMLIQLVKDAKISTVPYGWYLFGQCAVLQFEPQTLFETKFDIGNKYDIPIKKIIDEFSKISTTQDLLRKHYTDEGNSLYLTRLIISNILKNRFSQDSVDLLKTNLNNFMFSFPKTKENEDLIEYINGFASIMIRLLKTLNIEQLEEIRLEINDSFVAIWEIVGTYNLYESAKVFYNIEVIKKYYILRIENLKRIGELYLSELKDNLPLIKIKDDSLSKFKGIQVK
jgi:hypothetical protein